MKLRHSTIFILVTAVNILLLSAVVVHSRLNSCGLQPGEQLAADIVRQLHLTDLCLFTEARYTRHPAMADLHSPFQDHPLALEHFPSGSLISPTCTPLRSYAPTR